MSVCLFLHLPKTAGTTLKTCIYDEYAVEDGWTRGWVRDGIYYFPYGFRKAKRPRFTRAVRETLGRDDVRAVVGHFWFGLHRLVPRPSFYVTLLRDPVERVVSLYHHLLREEAELLDGVSLHEFVTELRLREVDNDQTRRIAGVEPPFGAVDEAVLELAKRNLAERFAFVGVTERFDESLLALKRRLGWEYVLYIPALVNHDRPAASSLPPETLARDRRAQPARHRAPRARDPSPRGRHRGRGAGLRRGARGAPRRQRRARRPLRARRRRGRAPLATPPAEGP